MDHGSPEISETLLARKVAKSHVEDWRSCFPTPLNPQRSERRTPASQKTATKGLVQGDKSLTRSAVENIRRLLASLSQANLDFSFMRSEELVNAAHQVPYAFTRRMKVLA